VASKSSKIPRIRCPVSQLHVGLKRWYDPSVKRRKGENKGRATRLLLGLASLFMFASAVYCQTDITLRFLDTESGKPIKAISVSVYAWDENNGHQKPQPSGILQIDKNTQVIKTDKDGQAIFQLYYQPSLKTLVVTSTGVLRGCSAYQFSIEEVLRSGIVASYRADRPTDKHKWCVALKAQATAKPGEVIIFDKRMTVLDRMRQEIP
jgi:hypothetical protein